METLTNLEFQDAYTKTTDKTDFSFNIIMMIEKNINLLMHLST